jgi:hypothetical protein
VIWHNHKIAQPHSPGIEEGQSLGQDRSWFRVPQYATAVALIEFVVQLPSLLAFERAADDRINSRVCGVKAAGIGSLPTWLESMCPIPTLAFIMPLGDHLRRNRIVLPKGDEVGHPRLSLMR